MGLAHQVIAHRPAQQLRVQDLVQPDQPLALPGMNRNTGCTPLLQGRRGLVQHLEELCGVHGFDEVVESPGCI